MAMYTPTSTDVIPTDYSKVKWATVGETSGIAAGQPLTLYSTASNRAYLAYGGSTTTFYEADVDGIAVATANRLQQVPYISGGTLTFAANLAYGVGTQLYLSSTAPGGFDPSSLVANGARAIPICVVQSTVLVKLNINATTAKTTKLGA